MRIHLAREHALELELLHILFHREEVALDFLNCGFVVLFDRKRQQLRGILEPRRDPIEGRYDLNEACSLPAKLLRLVRRIPNRRIF